MSVAVGRQYSGFKSKRLLVLGRNTYQCAPFATGPPRCSAGRMSALRKTGRTRRCAPAELLRALAVAAWGVGPEALLIFRGSDERTNERLLLRHIADCGAIDLRLPEQK